MGTTSTTATVRQCVRPSVHDNFITSNYIAVDLHDCEGLHDCGGFHPRWLFAPQWWGLASSKSGYFPSTILWPTIRSELIFIIHVFIQRFEDYNILLNEGALYRHQLQGRRPGTKEPVRLGHPLEWDFLADRKMIPREGWKIMGHLHGPYCKLLFSCILRMHS